MKTNNTFKVILAVLTAVTFFSCDVPVSLGSKLDLDGPAVAITSPFQRQSVSVQFVMEGTAADASGVERMEISAVMGNENFARRWRYFKGAWEISDNQGAAWSPYADAQWDGTDKSASWKVAIDMNIIGQLPKEGEYTFNVQAWDKGDMSDDNSFKALVLIIDRDPPKVSISYPFIYQFVKYAETDNPQAYEKAPLKELHEILDSDKEKRQDPAYLGKFITQEFNLKWQIDDYSDIWAVDLRLYKYDAYIDEKAETDLPDNYIFKYSKNTPPPPININPNESAGLNGSVTVPDLTSPSGFYDGGDDQQGNNQTVEIKNSLTEKATVKIVAVCYDAAGNASQEKTLGFFVYWPLANKPWIVFTEGLEPPDAFYGKPVGSETADSIESLVFKVYPGRNIKATAYQAHGVKEVKYTLYKCDTSGGVLSTETAIERQEQILSNPPSSGGTCSTIFSWEFNVPKFTGYYLIKARAFSTQNKPSDEYTMLFMVNDITFPDFTTPVEPSASEPLFLEISSAKKFTIRGEVSDATDIESLCLVWINPQSKDYAAMSQLAYFRDKGYKGWKQALELVPGQSKLEEQGYDSVHKNKLWKLKVTPANPAIDQETGRRLFKYSQEIDLVNDLNIAGSLPKNQPLKSQVFLMRLENPGKNCTIITYAPQGDTVAPEIKISNAVIKNGSAAVATCVPGTYAVIPKFSNGISIAINGTWKEDSVETLDINTFFKSNFVIDVNQQIISNGNSTLQVIPNSPGATEGTWSITTNVRDAASPPAGDIQLNKLSDTLSINVKTSDIGGNISEIASSWLIQSDNLKLMRISSEAEDGTYSTYTSVNKIRIFLEFSKPVKLGENVTGKPELILSSGSGNTARAVYEDGQKANQNSRQYFEYIIGANQNAVDPAFLNVTGLYYNGTAYAASSPYSPDNYPFTWSRGQEGEYEEVRLTMQSGKTGSVKEGTAPKQYYVRTLPTTVNSLDSDFQFTLGAGKHINIDTTAPAVTATSVKADSTAGYYNAGDIYFTITFNEQVAISGVPRFPLNIGSATVWTSDKASDVRVSGNSITFMYTIKSGDTSGGNDIYISNSQAHLGTITDIAGNIYPTGSGIAGTVINLSQAQRTLTGIKIEATTPDAPTVRLLPGNVTANTSNVFSQNVSGATVTGESGTAVKNLSNVYRDALWLAIQGTGTAAYKYTAIEYSINNGASWVRAPNTGNVPFQLTQAGTYNIIARQIDQAGNISANTRAVNFVWDPGTLISRISSDSANGTYTNAAGRNQIALTFYFRKTLRISNAATPTITINSQNSSNANRQVTANVPSAAVDSLTFTYTVADGDKTPASTFLDIVSIDSITAWDGNAVGNGVNVSSSIILPSSVPKLDANKHFTVATGSHTIGVLAFAADEGAETSDNYHGIRSDDGSYWTTLEIPFNRTVTKGSGSITITQIQGTGTGMYRLPAVMTEAQYNRFRNVSASVSGNTVNTNTYYTKGTNGYINGTGSDTSNKYVLQYNFDPRRDVTSNGTGFTDNTAIPSAFIDAFRAAEAISVNVNSQAVKIEGSGTATKVKVRLSGSNAPQVPGATYAVSLPAGLVIDDLGNSSALTNREITLRGVAKPFIRIRKSQDTISVSNSPSINQPRLAAAQPFLSYVRIDCRTPDSTITYTATSGETSAPVTEANNFANANHNNWNLTSGAADNNNMIPSRPGIPASAYTNSNQLTIGYVGNTNNSPTLANVQGFQWWARARAAVGATNSAEAEEVAYRTVITYQLRGNGNNADGAGNPTNPIEAAETGQSILAAGDQIWIRGGDAIGSSSIPGFPFTWEDNWDSLANRRAGIRLMSLVATSGDTINNSIWRLVTWDMNTTAYVDFIKGRDIDVTEDGVTYNASSADVAWQYGPKRWAYQRAGWTSFKDKYPIYAGKHRWCDTAFQWGGKWILNFSATFSSRPDRTANYSVWPGLNTQ